MDHLNSNTEHIKGKHLNYEDRIAIKLRLKDGWSAYKIAKYELHCSLNTVLNEIRRGTVLLYNGKVARYDPKVGQAIYNKNRLSSRKHCQAKEKAPFIQYVQRHFKEDGWSLDACVGRALTHDGFSRSEVVCTKTLYNYVSAGCISVKSIDLPEKLRRKPRKEHSKENKRILGRSIEERSEEVDNRAEFGHWECDLVIGKKTEDDDVLLTLAERMSRNFMIMRLRDKKAETIMEAIRELKTQFGDRFSQVFKTITTDNGSEFANLSDLEQVADTLVYYAHPFSSWEKGTVERHNGLIRRYIPKGKWICGFSDGMLEQVELWCNGLPRKILGYRTPEEVFDEQLDRIYAASGVA